MNLRKANCLAIFRDALCLGYFTRKEQISLVFKLEGESLSIITLSKAKYIEAKQRRSVSVSRRIALNIFRAAVSLVIHMHRGKLLRAQIEMTPGYC